MVWGANPALKGRDKGNPLRKYRGQCARSSQFPKGFGQLSVAQRKAGRSSRLSVATPSADFDASCYDPILEEYRKGAQNNYYNGDFSTLPHVNQGYTYPLPAMTYTMRWRISAATPFQSLSSPNAAQS